MGKTANATGEDFRRKKRGLGFSNSKVAKRRFRKGLNIGAFPTEVLQKAEWTAGRSLGTGQKAKCEPMTETPPSWAVT